MKTDPSKKFIIKVMFDNMLFCIFIIKDFELIIQGKLQNPSFGNILY